jgi:hypothetical protein
METAATIGQLWILAGIGAGALSGVLAWSWNALRGKANTSSTERLWSRHNGLSDEFKSYQVVVAHTYVRTDQMQNLKTDLERHIDRQFDQLRDDIVRLTAKT